jgi:hypothetical protein
MPTSFPFVFNNFEMTLAQDFTAGADSLYVSSADMARLHAAFLACDYTDPTYPGSCALKFTLIAPGALDSLGRLVDVTKTWIFIGAVSDFTQNGIDTHSAYQGGTSLPYAMEGVPPGPRPTFPAGSLIRCEPTAGLFMVLFKAINLIEAVTGTSVHD